MKNMINSSFVTNYKPQSAFIVHIIKNFTLFGKKYIHLKKLCKISPKPPLQNIHPLKSKPPLKKWEFFKTPFKKAFLEL